MRLLALSLALMICLLACAGVGSAEIRQPMRTLREAAGSRLQIGVAVNTALLDDARYTGLIAAQFNSVTAENAMKPSSMLRAPGQYDFTEADRFVNWARKNDIEVIGHTLVWHSQSPSFLFQDDAGAPLSREKALANLREHITTVVGHFKGRVRGWDVVNEAVADGGGLRQTPALRAIGEDYLVKAFQFAQEADPEAELYYNDYNIDMDYKRPHALALVKKIRESGARIDAVGIQGHYMLTSSMAEIKRGVDEFLNAGFKVHLTEVDVDPLPRRGQGGADVSATEAGGMDPYKEGLPAEKQQALADFYGELFDFLLSRPGVERITLWGLSDAHTWLNGFPVRGRTNHPLLFDRQLQPKPAFDRVLQSISAAGGSAGLRAPFHWEASGELVLPPVDPERPVVSIKDPSVVFHEGKWHIIATVARPQGGWQMVYLSFEDWAKANEAKPAFMDAVNPGLKGYHCAPQVFYFEPHKKWYLIYQSQHPQFSTTTNLSDPSSWSAPQNFFEGKPEGAPQLWIDYYIICDDTHAYLFFTGDDGKLYRSRTTLEQFPNGMSAPVTVMADENRFNLFEGSAHYKIKGTDQYLTIIEAIGPGGKRWYRAWTSDRLDGEWKPLADTWENPFASTENMVYAPGVKPWTMDISHGELLREGVDQRMILDPANIRFLFQGRAETTERIDYLLLPYRLGMLTMKPAPKPETAKKN